MSDESVRFEFNLKNLAELDGGRIAAAADAAIRRAIDDCYDRPQLASAREVVLAIKITPGEYDDGDLESCGVKVVFSEKTPKRESKEYDMQLGYRRDGKTGRNNRQLVFNELSLDNGLQQTIDQARRENREHGESSNDD